MSFVLEVVDEDGDEEDVFNDGEWSAHIGDGTGELWKCDGVEVIVSPLLVGEEVDDGMG